MHGITRFKKSKAGHTWVSGPQKHAFGFFILDGSYYLCIIFVETAKIVLYAFQGEINFDDSGQHDVMKDTLMNRLLPATRVHAIGVMIAGILTVMKTFKYLRKAPSLKFFSHTLGRYF